jgi:hypothetical protein
VKAFVGGFEANFGWGMVARCALENIYAAMTASDEMLAAEAV